MSEKKKQVKQPDMTEAVRAYGEGMALLQARELEKARERFEAALGLDAGYEVARYQLGAVLAMLGRHAQSLERFEELVQARGEYAFRAELEQGYVLYLAGRHEEAVQRLDARLKGCDEPLAWLFRSLALEALGRPEDAKKSFKKSVAAARREADGDGPCWWWSMECDEMNEQGWLERELICCDVLLRLDPKDYGSMEEKGCALRGLGHPEEALPWFDRALKVGTEDDGYWCTLYNKGLCLADLGRHEEAITLYDRVLVNDNNCLDILSEVEYARDKSLEVAPGLREKMSGRVEVVNGVMRRWLEVPEITHCGYGVQLIYGDAPARQKSEITIGFVKSYNWSRTHGDEQIIYVLAKDSAVWRQINNRPEEIMPELTNCINIILNSPKESLVSGQMTPTIYAHYKD